MTTDCTKTVLDENTAAASEPAIAMSEPAMDADDQPHPDQDHQPIEDELADPDYVSPFDESTS